MGLQKCKAMLLVASTDLPAKAELFCMKHHNGKCACPHCEAEGAPREGCPMQRNWPHQSSRASLRTHQKMLEYAQEANDSNEAVSLSSCLVTQHTLS